MALSALPPAALARLCGPAFLAVGANESPDADLGFVLFLRCDGKRIAYLEPGAQEARDTTLADFAARHQGEVLIASLSIQLVGLATPLFTQVIVDKVVVHQSNSTLTVIGVAFLMFMIFTSVMSWLRQYLMLHTGNRIDAVLGSQMFRHLLRLPMPSFEHRPTGTATS